MSEPNGNLLLGFDPGGKKGFGWCILEDADEGPLRIVDHGISDHAHSATKSVYDSLSKFPKDFRILGVGIDAPLFWSTDDGRLADKTIRELVRKNCRRMPGGTVQSVNSLRGACVAQGIMVAHLLRKNEKYGEKLPITEAHPKAFLYMRGIKLKTKLGDKSLEGYFKIDGKNKDIKDTHKKDVRDAAIAAYFAWVMAHSMDNRFPGWTNLFSDLDRNNPELYFPIEEPLAYWFPENRKSKP